MTTLQKESSEDIFDRYKDNLSRYALLYADEPKKLLRYNTLIDFIKDTTIPQKGRELMYDTIRIKSKEFTKKTSTVNLLNFMKRILIKYGQDSDSDSDSESDKKYEERRKEIEKIKSLSEILKPTILKDEVLEKVDLLTFLNKFNITQYSDEDSVNKIAEVIKYKNSGEGGFGSVFPYDEANIIKLFKVCPLSNNSTAKELCKHIKTNNMYNFIDTPTGKNKILAPNYITEYLVSIILQEQLSKYTNGFMNIKNFVFDDNHTVVYVMEKLDLIDFDLFDIDMWSSFIIRCLHILYIAQTQSRFVHFDLHLGNIMSRPTTDEYKVISFNSGKAFKVPTYGFEPVFIDYGFSRVESDTHIINPIVSIKGDTNVNHSNRFSFNPFIDPFMLLVSIIKRFKKAKQTKTDNYKLIVICMCWFLGCKDEDEMEYKIDDLILYSNRPRPETFYEEDMEDILMLNEDTLFELSILLGMESGSYLEENVTPDPLYIDERIIFENYTDKIEPEEGDTELNFELEILDETVDVNVINYKYKNPIHQNSYKPFVLTPFELSFQNLIINSFTIDTKKGYSQGYRFGSECCHINMKRYFLDKGIQKGLAINGGFFRIKKSYTPVGYTKIFEEEFSFSVPEEYKEDYCYVNIKDGRISISRTIDKSNDIIIEAGPLLVYEGKKIFTDETVNKNLKKYTCGTGKLKEKIIKLEELSSKVYPVSIEAFNILRKKIDYNIEILKNAIAEKVEEDCSIGPGNLKHAGNPNNRSCLALKGDKVIFMYVEGRTSSSDGMTIPALTDMFYNMGVDYAVNLDGGTSSQLFYRDGSNIMNVGDNKARNYPVGSILTYFKSS